MRFVNRLLTTLLSLALIAAAVLLIIEVVATALGREPLLWDWTAVHRWADRTPWQDSLVLLGCVLALVAGLVLLLAELKRPKVRRLRTEAVTPEQPGTQPVDTAYTRSGVARTVRAAVTDVDGVKSARVRVKHRVVKVKAAVTVHDEEAVRNLRRSAREAVRLRIEQLELRSPPSIKIRTRST